MDADVIMIGLGFTALMIGLLTWLKADISGLRQKMQQLDGRLRTVEHRQAKPEGLREDLCEAISARSAA